MQPLATNLIIGRQLRTKISWALCVLPLGLMFSAFVPLVMLVEPLARLLGVQTEGPLMVQPNGWLWVVLFLAMMVILMLAGAALGSLLNALIARVILRWPAIKVREVFLYSKVPAEWYRETGPGQKTNTAVAKRMTTWATTRKNGKWHFVLVRGVLGFGLPVFLGTSCVPVLRHRVQPTLQYFVPQILIFALSGILFGILIWHFSERQFRKQGEDQGAEPATCRPHEH